MRAFLFSICLLWACCAQDPFSPFTPKSAAAGGGGTCPDDGSPSTEQTGVTSSFDLGGLTAYQFGGQNYVPTANRTVCKVRFSIAAAGDITGRTYRAVVRSMSGCDLGTVLASSSTINGVNAWNGNVIWTLTSDAALTSGTTYFIGLEKVSGADSGSDNLAMLYTTSSSPDFPGTFDRYASGGTGGGCFDPGGAFANWDMAMAIYWK